MLLLHCSLVSDSSLNGQATSDIIYSLVLDRPSSKTQSAQWPTRPRSLGSRCNSPARWPTRPRSLGSRCNSPTIQARTYVPRNTAGDSLLGNLFKIAGKPRVTSSTWGKAVVLLYGPKAGDSWCKGPIQARKDPSLHLKLCSTRLMIWPGVM